MIRQLQQTPLPVSKFFHAFGSGSIVSSGSKKQQGKGVYMHPKP